MASVSPAQTSGGQPGSSRKRTVEILHQLGELFRQAAPTAVIVFLFYLFLRVSFFRPLERVLAERRARTEGDRRAAESSRAAAREKMRAYQEALKKARAEIYAEQETARRAILEGRMAMIRAARGRSSDDVRMAKEKIFAELARARAEVEALSPALAGDIARAILERRPPTSPSASEAR